MTGVNLISRCTKTREGDMSKRCGWTGRALLVAALCLPVAVKSSPTGADDLVTSTRLRRTSINLPLADREHMLLGMRKFLDAIQGILEGVSTNKMQLVARSARSVGVSMLDDRSIRLGFKLPFDFVILSMETHNKFDDLARDATEIGTKMKALSDLNDIVKNCTSCHAKYRFASERD